MPTISENTYAIHSYTNRKFKPHHLQLHLSLHRPPINYQISLILFPNYFFNLFTCTYHLPFIYLHHHSIFHLDSHNHSKLFLLLHFFFCPTISVLLSETIKMVLKCKYLHSICLPNSI